MNKKIIFSLAVIFCITILNGMKRSESTVLHQREKQQKRTTLHLPLLELQKIIVDFLPSLAVSTPFHIICKTINAFSLLNKQWNLYINNPQVIRTIINNINDQGHNYSVINQYLVAKSINTFGTKNYIQQSHELYCKIIQAPPLSPFSIEELVQKGADVNFYHLKGPYLHLAAKRNNWLYIQELLKYGADIDKVDKEKTALQVALDNGYTETVDILNQYRLNLLRSAQHS